MKLPAADMMRKVNNNKIRMAALHGSSHIDLIESIS